MIAQSSPSVQERLDSSKPTFSGSELPALVCSAVENNQATANEGFEWPPSVLHSLVGCIGKSLTKATKAE
jgi:hypothetical protein